MKYEYTDGASLLINDKEAMNLPIETIKEAITELINYCDNYFFLQQHLRELLECFGNQEDLGYSDQEEDFITKYTLNI